MKNPGKETEVDQVHGGMLDPPDIKIDRHPVTDQLGQKGHILRARRAVPEKVPGTVDKCVHGIGLAARRTPAAGTDTIYEWTARLEGVARVFKVHVQGKQDGKVTLGNRHLPTVIAVDDRDRRPPVTLAGEEPVAKLVVDGSFADPFRRKPRDDIFHRLRVHPAGEWTRVYHDAGAHISFGHLIRIQLLPFRLNHCLERYVILPGKFKVTLIMGRHRHHRPGPVSHQGEVGHPERDLLPVDGIGDMEPGPDSDFLQLGQLAGARPLGAHPADRRHYALFLLGAFYQLLDQWVFGSERHEGYPPESVRTGSEDGEFLPGLGDREDRSGAFRTADPFLLHLEDPGRPLAL